MNKQTSMDENLFAIYGPDFTIIDPTEVPNIQLPCRIAVACNNGWQVEGEEPVIRFENKGNGQILCMKLKDEHELVDNGVQCMFSKAELQQIRDFICKYYEILLLHICQVFDKNQLISALNLKAASAKNEAKYRIFAGITHDCPSYWYVDMNDMTYEKACEFYEKKSTEKVPCSEIKPGYYYLSELEIEELAISIPQINQKLLSVIESLENLEKSLRQNNEAVKNIETFYHSGADLYDYVKKFNNQHFINRDETYNYENDYQAAVENNELKKRGYDLIKSCYEILDEKPEIRNREKISEFLWELRDIILHTLRYKIYAYQDLHNENRWKLIGFANSIKEAYYYIENDSASWYSAGENKVVQHMFMEPDDECTQSEFKIESEDFVEYFDRYSSGPLFHPFKFQKSESICYFCGKTFDGYGKTCLPVQYRWNLQYGFNRCCPECEKKYLEPAEHDKEFCENLRRKFLFERPDYKGV